MEEEREKRCGGEFSALDLSDLLLRILPASHLSKWEMGQPPTLSL